MRGRHRTFSRTTCGSGGGSFEDDPRRNYRDDVLVLTASGVFRGVDGVRAWELYLRRDVESGAVDYPVYLAGATSGFSSSASISFAWSSSVRRAPAMRLPSSPCPRIAGYTISSAVSCTPRGGRAVRTWRGVLRRQRQRPGEQVAHLAMLRFEQADGVLPDSLTP